MKKFIFMLSASLLLLAACSKDDDTLVQQNGDATFVNKTFSATCKGQKAAFVPNTTLAQGFQSGDEVFIYATDYGNAIGQPGYVDESRSEVREDNNDFYSKVTFNVLVPDNATTYHAIMPYQDLMTSGKVTLPTLQVADKGSNDRNANILYASSNDYSFSFAHACAYIRLRVKSNSQSATRFVIHSSQPLSGECNYNFDPVFTLTGNRLNGGDSVSLTTENANVFEDTAYIATVLPTDENSTVIYEVKDASGKVVASCAVINRKFAAGSVYTVTLDGDKLTATGTMWNLNVFSVSATDTVRFSKGNLQYNASGSGTWRFAEHQWDYVGNDNANISDTYTGWIDLFGWGTGDNPTKHTTDDADYSDFINWGDNSKLITDLGAGWRTLSNAEWEYLIFNSNAVRNGKCGHATVNGVVGIVLLPDAWVLPEGCNFTAGHGNRWSTNNYEGDAWTKMEARGAVFLPAAGYRIGQEVNYVGDGSDYWSSTSFDDYNAFYLYFNSGGVGASGDSRFRGQSVRLVR